MGFGRVLRHQTFGQNRVLQAHSYGGVYHAHCRAMSTDGKTTVKPYYVTTPIFYPNAGSYQSDPGRARNAQSVM